LTALFAPSLAVALALAAADAAPQPAALMLPLRPTGSLTVKQASGARYTLKSAVERGAFAKVLSDSKDDARQSEKCELEAACLREVGALRGADVTLAGVLVPASDGLVLKLVAAAAPDIERTATLKLTGIPEDDAADVDRALREMLNPDALRGSIFVEGEEGSQVFIDGKDVGALPLKQQLNDVKEGSHEVVVTVSGLERFRRTVNVRHAETTMVRAVLLDDKRIASDPSVDVHDPGPPIAAIATTAAGGVLFAGGVVCGVFSLLASAEAEARAEKQQLLFPRDEGLLLRGTVLAWTANGLYLLGAAGLATGVALLVMGPGEATDEGATP
jgi:PEGA domain